MHAYIANFKSLVQEGSSDGKLEFSEARNN